MWTPNTSENRTTGIAAGGPKISTHLTTYSTLVVIFNPVPIDLPQTLASDKEVSQKEQHIYAFFQKFAKARVPLELQQLDPASHPSAELRNHARKHGLPIFILRGMFEEELCAELHYGAHSSSGKKVDSVHPSSKHHSPSPGCRLWPDKVMDALSVRHPTGGLSASHNF